MIQTSIDLPADLHRQVQEEATRRGIPVRELIEITLREAMASRIAADPMLDDEAVYEGPAPSDLSSNPDEHLYGKTGS